MFLLYHVFLDHGYAAVAEFIVVMGDQVITHIVSVLVIKAGVLHVGWTVVKVVRRVRANKVKDITKDN